MCERLEGSWNQELWHDLYETVRMINYDDENWLHEIVMTPAKSAMLSARQLADS